jgi:cytosine permease
MTTSRSPVPPGTDESDRIGGLELESEFEHTAVPLANRKSLTTVAAVWFGFPMILTNAIPGGIVVALLGFWPGIGAILVANLVMLVYVGLLSHRAGSTGESFALQATETFGRVGYIVASGFLATIVVGWFAFNTGATGATLNSSFGWNEKVVIVVAGVAFIAITFAGIRALSILGAIAAPLFILVAAIAIVIVARTNDLGAIFSYEGVGGTAAGTLTFGAAVSVIMATFADSGTMTADFTRWSKNGREAVLASATAFPVASMIAQVTGGIIVAAGAIAAPATDGGNFLPILTQDQGFVLSALAAVFVFVNLGSVCSHCLYNGAIGWSHLLRGRMRVLTLVLGALGIAVALAGVWSHFLSWLVILSVFVPPLGGVLIADQVLLRKALSMRPVQKIRATAFIAWAIGAAFAGLVHWQEPKYSDAVAGLLSAVVAYLAVEWVASRNRQPVIEPSLAD